MDLVQEIERAAAINRGLNNPLQRQQESEPLLLLQQMASSLASLENSFAMGERADVRKVYTLGLDAFETQIRPDIVVARYVIQANAGAVWVWLDDNATGKPLYIIPSGSPFVLPGTGRKMNFTLQSKAAANDITLHCFSFAG